MENEEKVAATQPDDSAETGAQEATATPAKTDLTGTVRSWFSTVRDTASGLVSQVTAARPWVPATDVYVTSDELVVIADLPGVSADNLEVDPTPLSITISGKRCAGDAPDAKEYIQRGRDRGDFEKTIALTAEIRHESVSAKISRGVLELRAPLAVVEKPTVTVTEVSD